MELIYRHNQTYEVLKREYGSSAPEAGTEIEIGNKQYKVESSKYNTDLKGLPYEATILLELTQSE